MRQADIFQDSEVWQQAVSLQDIADFLRAHLCQLLVGKAHQLLLFQLDTSLIRVGDAANQVEQGALPAAGRAGDDRHLPLLQGEADVADRLEGFLLAAVGFGQVFCHK